MARRVRVNLPGVPQHVVQRGNNKMLCFREVNDYSFYAKLLREYQDKFQVDIHSWVFMTNHVHLLCTPHSNYGVSLMMQSIGRRYVLYFNRRYGRTGTLWEGRFRSSLVDTDEYLITVYRYIEMNPVRAGITPSPSEYHWSSFATNAYGRDSTILTPHPVYLKLGKTDEDRFRAYRSLFINDVKGDVLVQIREALQANIALGHDSFKKRIEAATGQSQFLLSDKKENNNKGNSE